MKRLIPFDAPQGERDIFEGYGSGRNTSDGPSSSHQHCRLPLPPDQRRTAFHAVITGSESGLVFVRETPVEIVQVRDTELVQFTYPASPAHESEILLTVTEDTCYDVAYPYQLPDAEMPVIVIGLDLGVAIEAEILAGVERESHYRSLLMRYQQTRGWYRASRDEHHTRRQS